MSHDGAMDGPTLERLLSEQHWLRTLAARLVRDEAERDDLVQEAWLAALRERRGILDPRAWLAGVVRNRWRETRRGEERRRAREGASTRPAVPDPQDLAQSAELQQRLAQAVLALEEPYRACVLLHYWGGLAPAAIARREGIPAATVRSRLLRARELLRARFAREERGGRSWALAFLPLACDARPSPVPFALTVLAGAAAVLVAVRLWPGAGASSPEALQAASSAVLERTTPSAPTAARATAREELAPALHASRQEPGLLLRVLDPRQQPVSEARVAWSSSRGAGEALTDSDGRCTIPGSAWGSEPEVVVRVEAAGLFHAERRLAFAPKSTLVLEDEVALEGRVLDADDGSPWSGAEVWPFHGHCDLPPLTTDAEGRFRLDSVPIGRNFGVAVWSPGRPYVYRLARLDGPPSGPFVVWAHTEARVEGTVRDALTGEALADARVRLDESLRAPAPGGRFSLASERSDWNFTFEATGYVALSLSGVGDRRDFDVRLLPAGRVKGRITSPSGDPLPHARIHVEPDESSTRAYELVSALGAESSYAGLPSEARVLGETIEGRTDEDGRFELGGVLPEVRSSLSVEHEGTWLPAGELQPGPRPGGELRIERALEIARGAIVRGRVLDGGRPVRWQVRLAQEGSDPRVWSGTDGVFEFAGILESGALALCTDPSGTRRENVEIVPGAELEVELHLDLVQVTGVVLGAGGQAMVDEYVEFVSINRAGQLGALRYRSADAGARTDEDGAFVFELERELLPGTLSCNGALLQVADESAEPLVLRVTEESDPRGRLWLRPVDARTGAPLLAGILVERWQGTTWPNLGDELTSTPDLLGRFPFELPPGRHELAFGSVWEGYPYVVLQPFELAAGEERELRIEIERAPRVRFVFTGAEGAFDLDFQLARALDGREGLPFEAFREVRVENGEAEPRLPAGVYTLAARGLAFEPEQVTLAEGDPGPIVVRATRMP